MADELRILVCGSRTWPEDNIIIPSLLDGISTRTTKEIIIIQGEARGADAAAKKWAEESGAECLGFKAEWELYGKSAGYKRNQRMLDEGKPNLVLAFSNGPLVESRGTSMMVDIARKARVKTYVTERTPLASDSTHQDPAPKGVPLSPS